MSKKRDSSYASYAPDIPLQESQRSITKRNGKFEEAYPLTGADASQHRVDILPLWHPNRAVFKWVVLIISCMFSVGSYFAYDALGVVEEDIEEYFDITTAQFGLLYSVYSLPNIILPFFGGIVLDRIGLPMGTTACTFLVMAGALLVALAPALDSFTAMLIGRFIFGVGAETSYVAQNTICCAWFKDGKMLAFAMGLTVSAGRLGAFFTFSANQAIVEHFGDFSAALWAGALFSAVSFLAGLVYMVLHYYAVWSIKGTNAQLHFPESQPVMRLSDIINFPRVFYVVSLICCIYYSAVFPFQSTAVATLTRTKKMDENIAGFYVSIIPLTSLFLSPVFGVIVDKYARRVWFVAAGLAAMVPAFILLTEPWWPPLISLIIIGLCFALVPAAIWPCLPLLVEEKYIGTAFGLMSGFVNAGLTFFYWLQGEFISNDGRSESYLFSGMAGTGFLLTCLWLMMDAKMDHVCNRVFQVGLQVETPKKEDSSQEIH